jgi:hypothetical protein
MARAAGSVRAVSAKDAGRRETPIAKDRKPRAGPNQAGVKKENREGEARAAAAARVTA